MQGSSNIKYIVVDNEHLAIELLVVCPKELYSNLEVLGKYTQWNTALPALRTQGCDLLFLDISMPGKSGMELHSLLPAIDCEVIFITTHSKYAFDAFKFSPSGYMLKPIEGKDLTLAVDKTIERVNYKRIAKNSAQSSSGTKIGIPNNKSIKYLKADEIIYLEAVNYCTKVVAVNGEITSSYSLTRFMTIVEKYSFYQLHHSFIVNVNFLKSYEAKGKIIMTNEAKIPISKNVGEDFLLHFQRVSKGD